MFLLPVFHFGYTFCHNFSHISVLSQLSFASFILFSSHWRIHRTPWRPGKTNVLQCVVVCCSVWLCVAVRRTSLLTQMSPIISGWFTERDLQRKVCYSALQRVLQCVAVCCSVLQCVAVCCSVLQYVAVCCSVLHCVAVCVAVCCCVL